MISLIYKVLMLIIFITGVNSFIKNLYIASIAIKAPSNDYNNFSYLMT